MGETRAGKSSRATAVIGVITLTTALMLAGCGGSSTSTDAASSEPVSDAPSMAAPSMAAPSGEGEPEQATNSAGSPGVADLTDAGTLADADAAAAAAAVTCDGSAVPCALGNTGPGGGVVFYVDPAGFACGDGAACTALEGAPAGWSGEASDPMTVWCEEGQPGFDALQTDGGTFDPFSLVIGTGLANTRMIVDACGAATAAGMASAYTGGGLDDWYLPSIGELATMARPMFDTGTTQTWNGLNNGWVYWASSQSNPDFFGPNAADTAGYPHSEGNGGIGTLKTQTNAVHPIRAF